jgi:hypothetical protein
MSIRFLHITGSIIAVGIISAITMAILYFMHLPIFDDVDLAWLFVVGLGSAAISAATLAVRSIWSNDV